MPWYRVALDLVVLAVCLGLLGWLLWRALRRNPEPLRLVSRWIITGVLLIGSIPIVGSAAQNSHPMMRWFSVVSALVIGLMMALIWTPVIINGISDWIGSLYTGGQVEPVQEPVYSPARARRAQGHPEEALRLIQAELENFPADYTGPLLMAEIYAQDLMDLQAAETWALKVAHQPKFPSSVRAFALFSLADWYLSVQKTARRRGGYWSWWASCCRILNTPCRRRNGWRICRLRLCWRESRASE